METVKKAWGKEIWLVNNEDYCGKFLVINKGATSSYHYHETKRETFYLMRGNVELVLGENLWAQHVIKLDDPFTIEPMTPHSFFGVTNAVILEISTHHDDTDVVRLVESVQG